MKYNVAVVTGLDPDVKVERKILDEIANVYGGTECLKEEEVMELSRDADALLLRKEPVTKRVIDNSPKLVALVRIGIGVDNIDIKAATQRKILVANTPWVVADSVADHAMALILALMRSLLPLDRSMREGKWFWGARGFLKPDPGHSTLGLIGLGRIGSRVAQRAKPFGFKIIAYDPYIPPGYDSLLGVEVTDSLDDLLSKSDVVSIHTPLSGETGRLIGKKEFEKMKKTSYIVNTARGKIIDQRALYEALNTRRIAGAGLDVWEDEPPDPSDPIFKLDNIVCTPHMAGGNDYTQMEMRRVASYELSKILRGKRPLSPVNPEVYSLGWQAPLKAKP